MRHTTLSLLATLALAPPAAAQPPSYAKQIKPFFTRYCVECHSGPDAESGLALETYRALMEGGRRGAPLVPGKPDASLIVRMLERKQKPVMPPPKAKQQPTAAEVALVRAWVAAG